MASKDRPHRWAFWAAIGGALIVLAGTLGAAWIANRKTATALPPTTVNVTNAWPPVVVQPAQPVPPIVEQITRPRPSSRRRTEPRRASAPPAADVHYEGNVTKEACVINNSTINQQTMLNCNGVTQ